ncbi:MAG: hypothetical protein LUD03_01785, partial [Firmicutes bacterium]|nr:hypothetical protein [Bacillota bacterium]
MKKFIALLLSAAMLAAGAVTLTSCGGADDAPEPSPSAALSPEPTASEPAASESAASTQTNGETAQNSDEQ